MYEQIFVLAFPTQALLFFPNWPILVRQITITISDWWIISFTRWKHSCKLATLETRTQTTCWPFSIQGETLDLSSQNKFADICQFKNFFQDEVCCSWEVPICTPQKIWWVNISSSSLAVQNSSIGDLVTHWLTQLLTVLLLLTCKERPWRPVTFEIFYVYFLFNHFDNFYHFVNKDNPRDLWHLIHCLHFWQVRTWFMTIESDTGQHLQFLRCFIQAVVIQYQIFV